MAWAIPLAMSAGGLLSGLLGKKSSTWSGKEATYKKVDTLNHNQRTLLSKLLRHPEVKLPNVQKDQMYQQGTDYLSKILSQDPEMMKQFEAPYQRQFQEETVPGIAERFSGAGAQNSSAFGQTMGAAGAGLQEQLAALRANLGMNASQQAYSYAQLPFQQQYQNQALNLSRIGMGLGTPAFGYQSVGGTTGIGQGLSSGLLQGGTSAMGSMGILSMLGSLFGGSSGGSSMSLGGFNSMGGS